MKKHIALVATLMLGIFAGTAYATAESANVAGLPPGYLKINPTTCRFLHPEIDLPYGRTWLVGQKQVAQDDARHDVLDQCLRRLATRKGVTAPDKDGITGYVRVTAAINFKQASASVSCPAGDVVLGGGASAEVEGSYPSSDNTWTVTRDHTWGSQTTGSVYAVCAKAA